MYADDTNRIRHMRNAALDAIDWASMVTRADLTEDRKTVMALVKSIEMIGEAANHITPEFKAGNPEIPWRVLEKVGDRLTHAYFAVDHDLLWTTVQEDLHELLELVRPFLNDTRVL